MKADILLIEDNPYEAKLTISSLQEYNLANNIVHIDDGAEALDYIFCRGSYQHRAGEPLPKVVLLDLNLPKVSGIEVLRQFKSNALTKTMPVVVLTSSRERKDIRTAFDLGVNSYIVKPVEFDAFAKAVADLGLYWMMLNETDEMRGEALA